MAAVKKPTYQAKCKPEAYRGKKKHEYSNVSVRDQVYRNHKPTAGTKNYPDNKVADSHNQGSLLDDLIASNVRVLIPHSIRASKRTWRKASKKIWKRISSSACSIRGGSYACRIHFQTSGMVARLPYISMPTR